QPGIDVNVTANCRGPMPDHLAEDGTGQGHARDPEFIAAVTFVSDPPFDSTFSTVRVPGEPPPGLVDMGVGVHDSREGEEAPSIDHDPFCVTRSAVRRPGDPTVDDLDITRIATPW